MTNITLLVDNNAQHGLIAEHGFSALIEQGKQRILFDTGQGEALFINAKRLNISLHDLDVIILSHGHYDHAGNIAKLLADNPKATLYLHPDALQTRYSLHTNNPPKKISLSQSAIDAIQHFPIQQTIFNQSMVSITDTIFLSGEIKRLNVFEKTSGPFYLDTLGLKVDKLMDDQSLWIETDKGLTVITGCCHAGVINTLTAIQTYARTKKINDVIGGLHLINADHPKLNACVEYLNNLELTTLYPGHCTGNEAITKLNQQLTCEVKEIHAGLKINI